MSRIVLLLLVAACLLPSVAGASSASTLLDYQYRKVSSVRIQADGPVDEPFLLNLVEITPNVDILTVSKIRRSIELLYATGNFTNILVDAEQDGDRVALTFQLRLVYRFQYIHLTGTIGVPSGKIKKSLRLRKFEPYTPEKVLNGRDDLLEFLHENGYYDASVTQDVLLHRSAKLAEVTYSIQCGAPAYIGSLVFSGSPFFTPEVLGKAGKIATGSRFREFEFQKDLERIGAFYEKNGFLEHDIKVVKQERGAENRMQLEIAIQSGKQLLLDVKGFALSQDVLDDQLPIRADHSYNDDTLEEGKRNLQVYMQSKGYYDASVEWEKRFEKEKVYVTFRIQSGPQFTVSEIRIAGNANMPREDILKLMKTRKNGLLTSSFLVTKNFEDDLGAILSAYKERGFLFAFFSKKDIARTENNRLVVDLAIDEGPQVSVAEIRLKGNEAVSTEYFLQSFQQKVGEPLSQSKVKNDSNFIVAAYSDRGYPKVKLENKLLLSRDKTRAAIEYRIDEGEPVVVDRIVISGNYRTKRSVITENMYFAEDDPLSLRKIQESQSKLYALQIFDRVDFQLPRPDNLQPYQEVILKLTEAKPYTVSYGFGYETYDKFRGVFTLSNRNWRGKARSVSMQLKGGFKEWRTLFSYNDSHLLFKGLLSTLNVYGQRQSLRDSFAYRSYGVSFEAEKKLSPDKALLHLGQPVPPQRSVFFGYRFEDIDTFGTPTLSPEDRQFLAIHISSVSGSFLRDARDNAIDPTRGDFLSSDLEWATSYLGSESDYLKSFTWLQYYKPVKKTVVATSLRLGLAKGFLKTDEIPISQRFFAGGGRTVRGFDLDTAGPLDPKGQPLGGNMMFILNLENRFPIYKSLGGIIFFDWGNVFSLINDFRFDELRPTTGLGIRYNTAIGPVVFDWGYKLDRKPGESAYEFYLTIGNAF